MLILCAFMHMQNFTINQCGAVHLTMGDGGNIEGVCKSTFLFLSLPVSTQKLLLPTPSCRLAIFFCFLDLYQLRSVTAACGHNA